ncbi:MAG TPA: isocitrate lyase/PEP mutase family protein [Stellaceae bacterium]|nr:isocitrate lyase/PEP mutase family protein [Stellaceae bacterium]
MTSAAARLRELLGSPGLLVCPVIADPLSARLTAQAGLPMALLGGFGIAAARFAMPDTGLISYAEVLDQVRNTCAAVPGFPIVADGDTGYGNAMNVRRTVREFAQAGAAAILIEDQVWPKKCGHYGGGRPVIGREEARMKIRAAVEARGDTDVLIMARTDARSSVGFAEAMARCRAFEEEGADILFAEALESEAELRSFAGGFARPTWANMMPKTPVARRADLAAMGFKVVTYNVLLHAAVRAMRDMLAALAADDPARAPPLVSFAELTALVGLPEYDDAAARYRVAE